MKSLLTCSALVTSDRAGGRGKDEAEAEALGYDDMTLAEIGDLVSGFSKKLAVLEGVGLVCFGLNFCEAGRGVLSGSSSTDSSSSLSSSANACAGQFSSSRLHESNKASTSRLESEVDEIEGFPLECKLCEDDDDA